MKDLKGLKIHCDTQEEKKELLEEATKQGFVWCCGSEKPLEWSVALKISSYKFSNDDFKEIMNGYNAKSDFISYKEYKAMSGFTKEDLKPCMVVVLKDGSANIITQYKNEIALIDDNNTWSRLNNYSDDLHYKGNDNFDILQIYGFSDYISDSMKISIIDRPLLWERKEEPKTEEMTLAEVCKALGKNIKIVKE